MAYCSKCGALLAEGANFCANCGTAVSTAVYAQPAYVQPAVQQAVSQPYAYGQPAYVYTGSGCAVMLIGKGACGALTAANLISDTCGYTDAEAMQLAGSAPTLIAQGLSRDQAAYLAQALTEYGMQVAIYDRNGNQSFTSGLVSVFDAAGDFLTKVAASLGLIGIANRVTGAIRKLTLPHKPPVYRLGTPARRPPVRRQAVRREMPKPRPVQPMQPPQHHQPGLQGRPAPAHNGMNRPMQPGRSGHGGPQGDHGKPEHRKF